MHLINSLNWRYATKQFDPTKKISNNDLELLKEAVRLSASSYGLQAYKVLVVKDAELRERLKAVAWNQPQITDSSYLFVFCSYNSVSTQDVEEYMNLIADARKIDVSMLDEFKQMINGSLAVRSEDEIKVWTAKQTYIALGNLLSAAAELNIDACPMEGFDPELFNEILGLEEKGLSASVIATVGYRSDKDQLQFAPKVRKSSQDLFDEI